jgi:CheY-like chemotaxis protein/prolyl-tRNA editing enzyme YbaK/EbsC (Cys-tRNA(Pro) deacylase)
MALPVWLQRLFHRHDIHYVALHHAPVHTASRLAHAHHLPGSRVAKPVFLTHKGRPVTVVVPACARVDLASVGQVVGSGELRFATESEIAGWFKACPPGAVPPLRLRTDQWMLMDRSLAHLRQIAFVAGTPEDAVILRFRDWWRMVGPGVGRFTKSVPSQPGGAARPTVLVIEDESSTNQLFCQLLEQQGFACHAVEEGEQAVRLAADLRPSVIVLDLMLPDISGFDVYERLRRLGPLQRTPVVIVTALDDETSRQRGHTLGADAYLTKPFTGRTLVAELQAAVADADA